ncbi:unnamed protein product [Oreochromis niloticus]|nr:unnamed protein product [Mustela putorius furo]
MAVMPLVPAALLSTMVLVPAFNVQINITAGQNITLPCRAPNNNKIIIVMEWSRPDLQAEYVLCYRDEQFDLEYQHLSFKNRVDLQDRQMKDGDVSLILYNVTTADAGTYECRVIQKETSRRKRAHLDGNPISIIYLSVVDPPDVNTTAGQNVILTCRAPNYNIIVADWSRADLGSEYVLLYRDGCFDPENQHPSFKNRVDLQDRQMKDGDVSLILKNVTINDTGTYECRVANRRTNRGKRAVLKSNPISIIHLSVDPPGQTGGDTEDGGKEDIVSRGRPGLSAFAVICVVIAAFVISGKLKNTNSSIPSPEQQEA